MNKRNNRIISRNNFCKQLENLEVESISAIKKPEAMFLFDFLRRKSVSQTLEIGFASGISTASIISATQKPHYVIDPYQDQYDNLGKKNIKKLKLDKYLHFHSQQSHTALPKFVNQKISFDFAFIDGGHRFDEIFVDFYYIDLLLNDMGYVIFHDTWMRSTQMVLSWIKKNKLNYKVIKCDIKNFAIVQKRGSFERIWYHFGEFYTFKALIPHNIVKLKFIMGLKKK